MTGAHLLTAPFRELSPRRHRATRAERRLAKRLRERDPQALQDLHADLGSAVFGFLRHALGDRWAAEDVTQQVFLEIWQRGPQYDPDRASPLTWAMTIARSRAIDHQRRRVPEPRDPAGEEQHDAERRQRARRAVGALAAVGRCCGRLPAQEADVLRRRFYEGRSQAEIAADTGVPLGTVKSRMTSGLERLREELGREEEER